MVSTGISFSTARSVSGFIPLVMYRVGAPQRVKRTLKTFPLLSYVMNLERIAMRRLQGRFLPADADYNTHLGAASADGASSNENERNCQ